MLKVGADATFHNMGGCPDAAGPGSCANGVPDTCLPYLVDIGAHWELSTTQQGIMYPVSAGGTGNDPVANKDDEYAVSSSCRFDDDGPNAANEWSGAWAYSDTDSEYIFELSRLLKTAAPGTDAQLAPGQSFDFGIAYWDPMETSNGWTGAGHFLTGCAMEWIDLVLEEDSPTSASDGTGTGGDSSETITSMGPLVCSRTTIIPTLDADLAEWENMENVETQLHTVSGTPYPEGNLKMKCAYDDEHVYFSLFVPGEFSFDAEDDRKCAAMYVYFCLE